MTLNSAVRSQRSLALAGNRRELGSTRSVSPIGRNPNSIRPSSSFRTLILPISRPSSVVTTLELNHRPDAADEGKNLDVGSTRSPRSGSNANSTCPLARRLASSRPVACSAIGSRRRAGTSNTSRRISQQCTRSESDRAHACARPASTAVNEPAGGCSPSSYSYPQHFRSPLCRRR